MINPFPPNCTPAEGEHIEMGGIIDPEGQRALVYRKTTQVETVDTEAESGFHRKKIKKVTSESSWIGTAKDDKERLLDHEEKPDVELQPWQDQEVETNPLYSSDAYDSDFTNPLYTLRHSKAGEGGATAAAPVRQAPQKERVRGARAKPKDQLPLHTPTDVDTFY